MSYHKFTSWFLTETGKSFAHGSILFVNALGIFYHFCPETLLLSYYTQTVHLYDKGNPVPLSEEVLTKFEKSMEILKVSELHKRVIKPFTVCGFDVFNAGQCASRTGAAIGIPSNFDYKSTDDIDKENIRVNLKHVDWTTEVGEQLGEAIVLPEKVQIFALCREILQTQSYRVYLNTFYGIAAISSVYGLSMNMNKRLRLLERPSQLRYTLYTGLAIFGMGIYFLVKDSTAVRTEESIDKKLADLGPEFIESGIVFYDKILKRNQSLRTLMGSKGEKKYSKLGNENFFIRNVRLPIVRRKQYFERRKREYEAKMAISDQ